MLFSPVFGFISGLLLLMPFQSMALATVESRTGEPARRSSVNTSEDRTARLLMQIETLKQEITELRGQVEMQDHEMAQLKKSQQDFYIDLEKRLTQIQQKQDPTQKGKNKPEAVAIESKPTKMKKSVSVENEVAIEDAVVLIESPIEEVASKAADTATKVVTPSVSIKSPSSLGSEKEAYESAYQLVRTKHYDEATSALQDYITEYPSGEYAASANYWLGEVHMVQWQKDKTNLDLLNKAFDVFLRITTQFPTHQKATDALLKLGLIEIEKGNFDAARQHLTDVKNQHPGSAAARIAETRLQQMS